MTRIEKKAAIKGAGSSRGSSTQTGSVTRSVVAVRYVAGTQGPTWVRSSNSGTNSGDSSE